MAGPFYIDPKNPGIVRGGFFDEMGGILVGVRAPWVCAALNEKRERDAAMPPRPPSAKAEGGEP